MHRTEPMQNKNRALVFEEKSRLQQPDAMGSKKPGAAELQVLLAQWLMSWLPNVSHTWLKCGCVAGESLGLMSLL